MPIVFEEAKEGFLFNVLSSDHPLYETFAPNLIDQRQAMKNQFDGMTDIPFAYDEFERTRNKLVHDVKSMLTEADKDFLLSFESSNPQWNLFDYQYFSNYPTVKWKLQNLSKLKQTNPHKLQEEVDRLKQALQ